MTGFFRRILRAAVLDKRAYEEVEADRRASTGKPLAGVCWPALRVGSGRLVLACRIFRLSPPESWVPWLAGWRGLF